MDKGVLTEYQVCKPKIMRTILKKIESQAVADDIMQEVFLKIAKHEEKAQNLENLCGYMHQIAHNMVIDYFRQIRKNITLQDFENRTSETQEPNSINPPNVQFHLTQLPEKYQEALHWVEIEGKSQKEVAEILNISYSGLKSRVQRGRTLLKEQILKCCNYEFDTYGNIIKCCGQEA